MSVRHRYGASEPARRVRQRGAAAVEFALVASLLFTLLFGIMEMGRVLFYWNTATEAPDWARLAVVCVKDAAAIKSEWLTCLAF
jgi:Flp pilus assembly protein TadG